MTSPIPSVIEQQTLWARSQGFEPRNAYLSSITDNLRQELSSGARTDFERGSGRELRERGIKPPRMQALRSSCALSLNVFDYWRSRDPYPLQYSLHLRERITRVSFEESFATGIGGNPPNVDVLLRLENNQYVAIESKFTEWLTRRERSIEQKYFADGQKLWADQGLHRSQALADSMRDGSSFHHLDVPRLLKHALGLARKTGLYELYYLYFDWNCPESDAHAAELARFTNSIGMEIRFRTMTYQELFARLDHSTRPSDEEYMDYLTARYAPKTTSGQPQ
jgi:hypothetical protein